MRKTAMNAVEPQEMRVGFDWAKIVESDDLDIGAAGFHNGAQDIAPNAPETVDRDFDCHFLLRLKPVMPGRRGRFENAGRARSGPMSLKRGRRLAAAGQNKPICETRSADSRFCRARKLGWRASSAALASRRRMGGRSPILNGVRKQTGILGDYERYRQIARPN
jgi:hypothetical protein